MSKSLDSPVKIILADDSITMHRAVSLALKNESYQLICVDNGKDALRLVSEHRPQVALLDLDMPEMTGIEVAQAIRQDSNLQGTQLILLCGSFDDVNEKDVERAPVDARLWKPFESHVLLAMLRTLLKARNKPLDSTTFEATAPLGSSATRPIPHQAIHGYMPQEETLPPPNVVAEEAKTSASPTLPPPPKVVIAPPKSRKDQAVEEISQKLEETIDTVQELSPQKADILKKTVEATRPIEIKDLFDPSKKAQPQSVSTTDDNVFVDETDFSRSLTRETFHDSIESEDSKSEEFAGLEPEQSAESFYTNISEPSMMEETLAQNLWETEEFTNKEVTVFTAVDFEQFSSDPTLAKEDLETPDFEVLSSATIGGLEDLTTKPVVENVIENVMTQSQSSDFSKQEIQQLVESEVRKAFQGWLHVELKKQLNEVLSEIDKLDNELH